MAMRAAKPATDPTITGVFVVEDVVDEVGEPLLPLGLGCEFDMIEEGTGVDRSGLLGLYEWRGPSGLGK
jgi:hypothetical protein